MKGIIIYEDYRGKEVVEAIKLGMVNYECKSDTSDGSWINNLSGVRKESTQAYCNKEDTYDFETGALIALMKMCGFDKSYKAIEEAFKYNSYDAKKTKELEENVILGGRQNGKQYTFLVDLFKKIDQKKVDAAYKEAYNTTLPVWQKEVLNQMYGVYKESKEKIELQGFHIETKPSTKREEIWAEIFALHKESDIVIKVKKEDVNTFLHEIEKRIPEITWLSTVKIFETKYTIGDIYKELKTCDAIYFRLWKDNKLSFTSDPHIYPYRELKCIDYLPPMRWDLFEKGRIYVKMDAKHFDEFKQACIRELGVSPNTGYFNGEMIVINIPKEERFVITRDLKGFKARKIINWEDVR